MKTSLTIDRLGQTQFPFNAADDLSLLSESDLRELVYTLRKKLSKREAVIEE
jgi:hypothetical protein